MDGGTNGYGYCYGYVSTLQLILMPKQLILQLQKDLHGQLLTTAVTAANATAAADTLLGK